MGNLRPPAAGALLLLLMLGTFCCSSDGQKLVMMPSLEEQSVFQGSSFFVSCGSEVGSVKRLMWTAPEGQQITNYTGSVPYNQIPRIHVEDGRSGNQGVDLVFENIMTKDKGLYTCSANVDGSEESLSFNLLVHKKIDYQNTQAQQFLEEGNNTELHCDVDGDPEPIVTWRVNGKKVTYGDKYERGATEKNNLLVRNVTREDAGHYVCNAVQLSAHISEVRTFDIEVKVHHKPLDLVDDEGMQQAYSFMQGHVNLTCEAVAEPQANFTWIKDGSIIYPSDTTQIFTDAHQSVLQLTINNQDQFGDYLCKAENKLGILERVIVLEKGDKPPTPEFQVKHAEVNALHLTLGARDRAMPILAYRVQYKEPGNEWSRAHAVEFKNGEEYVINSLKEDTLYVLRAAARNAAGYSDFTGNKMQRTEKPQAYTSDSSVPTTAPLLPHILAFLALAARL